MELFRELFRRLWNRICRIAGGEGWCGLRGVVGVQDRGGMATTKDSIVDLKDFDLACSGRCGVVLGAVKKESDRL